MTKAIPLAVVGDFDNEKRLRILGIIDKIRELGISESVSLPQLVVVGDQSSGKSSLLEGLTGLSFPVASDLCTRFATQIVLRRAPSDEAQVKISIIAGPAAQANEEALDGLRNFQRTLAVGDFGSEMFQKIIAEAAECMRLPASSAKDLEDVDKRFSDDVLKIELAGPDQHHLSFVDVPGLFHNPTKYQTEEDRAVIRRLIENYITDPRTIILAVMNACTNLANQEVFSMARAADPDGKRTVGIITKCDAVQAGDEQAFAVKNRSTQDIAEGVSITERHKREKLFFSTVAPWKDLKAARTGVNALKGFLGRLLYSHAGSEFPDVVKDIVKLSASTLMELELLGPSRQTSTDQRRCLMRLASVYQQDVNNGLNGNYDSDLGKDNPLKLRMRIRNLNDEFAIIMARSGHAKIFKDVGGALDNEFRRMGPQEDILHWIRGLYKESRGTELPGTINPKVVENMFRQQSLPWVRLANRYMREAGTIIREFNDDVLERRISDHELRDKVKAKTVNHYFADTLSAIREERMIARLKNAGVSSGQYFDLQGAVNGVHLSNEDQAVNDIHDTLKAYYKVALKRFVDNVVIQITERIILGPNGSVRWFSPEMIGDLQDDELAYLAAENFSTSTRRNELQIKYDRLQKALVIAKGVVL
ncbi:hypothetical protein BU24DRAFT_415823 [Aaosphaeria arxii CBS 175.79]|uniref:P-loop containing nucleoside triphosphate hydrolase protein n=1 Tax=Aaosphaeria arxii CBS 175.79 TaxID=1450172 RepID=A0A6A5X629_9PLEO|nr:uncharacterized protein BU24DRAFT_415823 [Aaosphaeria arxii CBS 175.79]KAF2008465.1 hypothetical protein BU24DRAFT_415823 [Aaosphaeria arxii CBS 175.79]